MLLPWLDIDPYRAFLQMLLTRFFLLCSNLALLSPLARSASGGGKHRDIIDTGYAKYLGNRTLPHTVAYLGVPYAEPPLGDLRFRAPLPLDTARVRHESRGKLVDARSYPAFCIQGTTGGGDAGGAGSEDCLKVNIYAPVGAKKGSNLPVLVYIHGGGYIYGNPRNWPFDHWIEQSPNVVIVSVYYRLSSFGFLASSEFSDSDIGDLNAGFLDQVQALRWVKEHIAAFGGSPEKVTINGESAGGSSIELHLVANVGEQLFSGAIAQSVYRTPVPTPEQQDPLFDSYASQAGCGSGNVAEKMSCLRSASISALARVQDARFDGPYAAFHPVLDGKVLTQYPTQSLLSGSFAKVPLIVGSTSNETSGRGSDLPSRMRSMYPQLDDSDIEEFEEVYDPADFTSEDQRVMIAGGESMFICGRAILGSAFAKEGNAWAYRYNQPNPTSGRPDIVAHAAENWMMFKGSNTGPNGSVTFTEQTPVEEAFASELIAYWLSFVRSGDPNTFKLEMSPTWEPYTTDSKQRISLQQDPNGSTTESGSLMETEPDLEGERCAFVASKVDEEQN